MTTNELYELAASISATARRERDFVLLDLLGEVIHAEKTIREAERARDAALRAITERIKNYPSPSAPPADFKP
jgi:hypothetical protein